MKRLTFSAALGGILIGSLGTMALTSHAGTPPARNSSRVILENDLVRVKEAIFQPGDNNPGMHTHEYAHVGVPLDDGTLRFRGPDGKVETVALKRGAVGYRGANATHEGVNVGKAPLRVIEVEIKRAN